MTCKPSPEIEVIRATLHEDPILTLDVSTSGVDLEMSKDEWLKKYLSVVCVVTISEEHDASVEQTLENKRHWDIYNYWSLLLKPEELGWSVEKETVDATEIKIDLSDLISELIKSKEASTLSVSSEYLALDFMSFYVFTQVETWHMEQEQGAVFVDGYGGITTDYVKGIVIKGGSTSGDVPTVDERSAESLMEVGVCS